MGAARDDSGISGAALTGSAAAGSEDRWSDIDLAFGIVDAAHLRDALSDWTDRMYRDHEALHHFDVVVGATIYRVFLLAGTLQVDLAFSPAEEFGARAPTFRLVFGKSVDMPHVRPPAAAQLIGMAWLHALHARSCIGRDEPWQAEFMISGIRDHALALACVRHDLPAVQGRGMDRLPPDVKATFEGALVRTLERDELRRALAAVIEGLMTEIRHADHDLATRLEAPLMRLAQPFAG